MQTEPCQRVERSYPRRRKIEVLCWLKYYRGPNTMQNTAVKMRPPTLDEASTFFKIPKSTIARWRKPENMQKIIEQVGGDYSYRDASVVFNCQWPEMETKLFDAFLERRGQGRLVWDGWFRRKAKDLWASIYSELPAGLFVFSVGWFRGFLSRRVVLWFVTNTAQSLPVNYKEKILEW